MSNTAFDLTWVIFTTLFVCWLHQPPPVQQKSLQRFQPKQPATKKRLAAASRLPARKWASDLTCEDPRKR